jgi:hypothetical protein
MLSLRNAVIALVASAALVLVLVGVSAGVFTSQPSPPSVGQSASVNQGVTAPNRAVPMPPDVAAPVPAAPAPAPAPAAPVQHAAAPAPVPSEPVTHYRPAQVPVQQQPAPAAQPVTSVAPAQDHRPVSPPPSSALPARDSQSRTVNTEPCACDGRMRQVSTHWDPPKA